MKRRIILLASLLATVAAFAANYQLTWDATSGATGYKVYSSTNGTTWKLERQTANTTVILTNVSSSVVAFGVSATNVASESGKATADILFPPGNVRIITLEP